MDWIGAVMGYMAITGSQGSNMKSSVLISPKPFGSLLGNRLSFHPAFLTAPSSSQTANMHWLSHEASEHPTGDFKGQGHFTNKSITENNRKAEK